MASRLLGAGLVAAVGAAALNKPDYFSLHPICMTAAFGIAMSEGIRALSASTSRPHKQRVNSHAFFLIATLATALFGLSVAYGTKTANGWEHFTTPHGAMGRVAVIWTAVGVPAGILLRYSPKISGFPVPYRDFRFYHGLSGATLQLVTLLTMMGGVASPWFSERVHPYVWVASMGAVGGLALLGLRNLVRLVSGRMKKS